MKKLIVAIVFAYVAGLITVPLATVLRHHLGSYLAFVRDRQRQKHFAKLRKRDGLVKRLMDAAPAPEPNRPTLATQSTILPDWIGSNHKGGGK